MPEKTQLSIAEPCHEQWSEMQPEADGRFCGSCQRTVIDFTMMSDQEILSWLSGTGKSVCGRFMEDQLNRDLSPSRPPKKNRWAVWQFLLTGLLLSSEVSAQDKAPDPPVIKFNNPPASSNNKQIVVGGVRRVQHSDITIGKLEIVDSTTGEAVPGATIRLDKASFSADNEGRVSIEPEKLLSASALEITAIGYRSRILPVDKRFFSGTVLTISLSRTAEVLGDVTVVAYGTSTCRRTMGLVSVVRRTTIWQDTLAFLGLVKTPFTVYPNPVARGVSVTISLRDIKAGNYIAQLISTSGALVETMRMEGVEGARTALMNIPETMAAGTYIVKLLNESTGRTAIQKLVVL
ncbi:T9SS type A sorting domain-containing protein [Flavitalea sp. BT771]|uniref:T9SS type A sorting domain-containing protein n=1 Tax=Flavitalea sp. BT771 TaxID=3063329 RepID=UPI0026E19A45|nr:T9SS type A sorting domain-containing protein [Flavitalea sp. BT771]MDO6431001.1 T9SS type A sorting domain-containing protein [Flavitalea sp. BT771]MDV6219908.1 T9SS type A sorting domain-containing protein [Flavitalea sp. BT771]